MFCSEGKSAGSWLRTPHLLDFCLSFQLDLVSERFVQEEQQEPPGKVTKPLLNLPTYLWRNTFIANHQPSCGFRGRGFLSAEHRMSWRTSGHGELLCRWQILGLTSARGGQRCTQPSHWQEVVLFFACAPGYCTECHYFKIKCFLVTMAPEHRNSLWP